MKTATDDLINALGNPGKFQVLLYLYLATNWTYCSWNHLGMAFLAAKTDYSCKIDNNSNVTTLATLPFLQNGKRQYDRCHVYGGLNSTEKIPCPNGWIYKLPDRESTIISEWDLVCGNAYKASLSITLYFVGVMLGSLTFGLLSDKFGRRPVFLCTMTTPFFVGLPLLFTKNFAVFAALRLLLGFLIQGIQIVSFTRMIEITSTRYRTYSGFGVGFPWAIGMMLFSLFSYLIKDWRYIQLLSTTVCLLQIGQFWFLPESIRWLLINQCFDKAENVVHKISKFNNIPVPTTLMQETINEIKDKQQSEDETDQQKITFVFNLLKSDVLRKRTLILMVAWFSTSLGYYGLTLNISNLAGSKYLNYFISAVLEIFIVIVTISITKRFGRRRPLFVYCLIGSILLIIAGVIPKSNSSIHVFVTIMALIGRMFLTGNFSIIFVFTSELYPTAMRNLGLGVGIFWARVGSIAAPQILLLGTYTSDVMSMLTFGCLVLICGVLVCWLPETFNVHLPECMKDAEKQVAKRKKQDKACIENEESKDVELKPLNKNDKN